MNNRYCFNAPFMGAHNLRDTLKVFDFTLGELPSGMQIMRASAGTGITENSLFNYPPNTPRFENHGLKTKLLLEPQSTNLLTNSGDIGGTGWFSSGVTVTDNYGTAPDGTQTSTRLVGTTSGGFMAQIIAGVADGDDATGSIWIKGTGTPKLRFDEAGGDFTRYADVAVTPTAEWQRYDATMLDKDADTNSARFLIASVDTATDIEVWGAQVEKLKFATSYIPTTSSSVTRGFDSLKVTDASFYNQTEGTFVIHYTPAHTDELGLFSTPIAAYKDGDEFNERIVIEHTSGGNIRAGVFDGGVTQSQIGTTALVADTEVKVAIAYKLNDIGFAVNGTAATTDTTATLPTVDAIGIGRQEANGQIAGHIAKAVYYPERLSNAKLEELTS